MGVEIKDSDGKNIDLGRLLKKFEGMPEKLMNNALKAGVRAAAAEVRNEARMLAPRKTGKLAKSIHVKLRRSSNKNVIRFSVSTGKFYARFIEFGASPHQIALLNKKLLSSNDIAYGGKVNHPGLTPKPFMRPALDIKESKIVGIVAKKIEERVARLAEGKE
jgi:HK97 gp10 family phage protein